MAQMLAPNVEFLSEIYWREGDHGQRESLAAGSGLLYSPSGLWIVADDLHHIIHLPTHSAEGRGHRIFAGDLPEDKKARKKIKPDSEALIAMPQSGSSQEMIVFPSGSKKHRTKGKRIQLNPVDSSRIDSMSDVDFSDLLHALEKQVPDLNIEGGVFLDGNLILFQRGNGESGLNGFISMSGASFAKSLSEGWDMQSLAPKFTACPLPFWSGVPLTFTDGFVRNGRLYFSAAAEGGKSTYLDGQVMGSCLGFIDSQGNAVELMRIPDLKIEGVAVATADEKADSFDIFAVTDADSPDQPSLLLKITIESLAFG